MLPSIYAFLCLTLNFNGAIVNNFVGEQFDDKMTIHSEVQWGDSLCAWCLPESISWQYMSGYVCNQGNSRHSIDPGWLHIKIL